MTLQITSVAVNLVESAEGFLCGVSYTVLVIRGKIHFTYDIYGIDYEGASNDGIGKDCVICLTDSPGSLSRLVEGDHIHLYASLFLSYFLLIHCTDVTVMPCRHMCICRDCADVFRHQSDKCPICRAQILSLVQLVPEHIKSPQRTA